MVIYVFFILLFLILHFILIFPPVPSSGSDLGLKNRKGTSNWNCSVKTEEVIEKFAKTEDQK